MTSAISINMRAQPSPIIGGNDERKGIPHGLEIVDETGAGITDESGQQLKKD